MRDQKEEAARAPQETERCTGGWKGSRELGAGDVTQGPNIQEVFCRDSETGFSIPIQVY